MAWTTPSTVVAGQTLSASFWNQQVRDNLTDLDSRVQPLESATFIPDGSQSISDLEGWTWGAAGSDRASGDWNPPTAQANYKSVGDLPSWCSWSSLGANNPSVLVPSNSIYTFRMDLMVYAVSSQTVNWGLWGFNVTNETSTNANVSQNTGMRAGPIMQGGIGSYKDIHCHHEFTIDLRPYVGTANPSYPAYPIGENARINWGIRNLGNATTGTIRGTTVSGSTATGDELNASPGLIQIIKHF